MISVPASQTVPTNEMMSNMGGLDEFFDVANLPLLNMFDVDSSDYGQWPPAVPSPFDYRFPPQATTNGVARDVDKWHVSNGAFISCLDSVKKRVATNEAIDLHVPFKAAIWGWDNVGPEAQHPVWAALRQVDQKVFGTWTSTAQRIALMYVCQTLIQVSVYVSLVSATLIQVSSIEKILPNQTLKEFLYGSDRGRYAEHELDPSC